MTNIAPQRPSQDREIILANGRLVRDAEIVLVTIAVHAKIARAVSVVPDVMIAVPANLDRSRRPTNQRFNQRQRRTVVSTISEAASSTSNRKSRRRHRACPMPCLTVNLLRSPLLKVHKLQMPF